MSLASDISAILPHRAQMLMVSKVLNTDDESIQCLAYISEGNPFLKDKKLPSFVGLELIAQSAGIFLGIKQQANDTVSFQAPSAGAIVAVRNMKGSELGVEQGQSLEVKACFLGGGAEAAMFSGEVFYDKKLWCSVTVTIALFNEENGNG